MRLTKLELHGFTSFADHTELLFEPGVTAIVGPNGCGKSNVSDDLAGPDRGDGSDVVQGVRRCVF